MPVLSQPVDFALHQCVPSNLSSLGPQVNSVNILVFTQAANWVSASLGDKTAHFLATKVTNTLIRPSFCNAAIISGDSQMN